jgi:tetratricopeptide (TPR) repeat protein
MAWSNFNIQYFIMDKSVFMRFIFLFSFLLFTGQFTWSQKTAIILDQYSDYRDAMDLYDKSKFSAAQDKFNLVMEKLDSDDEIYINAEFYAALCALKLLHPDAEYLLQKFIMNHPESPQVRTVYMHLGRHYFDRKQYKKSIEYFELVDLYDLSDSDVAEYYFKTGYAYFSLNDYDKAATKFFEIKDKESEYQIPALYYYSHIAYQNGKYEAALSGFLILKDNANFKSVAPFYISQIYFRQNRYEEVVKFAVPLVDSVKPEKAVEMNKLIGDSYYNLAKYQDAIPYLKKYNSTGSPNRQDHYTLGYAYYRSAEYKNATIELNHVVSNDDVLAQTAYYHMGDAYLKINEKIFARNAFQGASKMSFDKTIEEDATFSYAKLAYELSYNPFHEAIVALQNYLEKYPNSKRKEEAYSFLINVYLTTKNYQSAIDALDKIKEKDIRMQSAYQFVVYNRGIESYLNGRFVEAITYLKKVKTYPLDKELNVLSKYWIAESNYSLFEYEKAIEAYNDFISEPGAINSEYYSTAQYNLGYSWYSRSFSNGKYDVEFFKNALSAFRNFITQANSTDYKKLADACLRAGDIYYAQADNENAIKYYEQSLRHSQDNADYAYFHQGIAYKLSDKKTEAIATFKKLINGYSSSKYVAESKFEIADIYRVNDNRSEAIEYYNEFVYAYPNHPKVKDALIYLGQLHYLNKDYAKSETFYKKVLKEYKDKESITSALNGLNPVYIATNRMDEYKELVDLYGMGDEMKDKLEDDYYDAAAKFVTEEKDCEKAIEGFNKYLRDFSNGKHALKAHHYRGECLYEAKQYDLAITDFDYVVNQTSNTFSLNAAWRLAVTYYYQKKDYSMALKYYDKMEIYSTKPKDLHNAYVGKLYCYGKLGDHANGLKYADLILQDATSTEDEKLRANYAKGNAYMNASDYVNAITAYQTVYKTSTNQLAAESRYQVAYIYYLQKDYKKSEKEIFDLAKQKPSYDYWVAKGYILLADNYVEIEDNFQAKATLQSIIDNYSYEDDIVPTAKEKLQKILDSEELQNQQRKVLDGGGFEIDIENGGKVEEVKEEIPSGDPEKKPEEIKPDNK